MSNHGARILFGAVLLAATAAGPAAQASTVGQFIDDATITTKVKAALLTDSQLKATKVSVQTDQGIVKLTGIVDTKPQEAEAMRVASQVDGVQSTQDMLTVRNAQMQ